MLDHAVLHDTSQAEAPAVEPADDGELNVRIMIGAQHAYACITGHAYAMDVRLEPGRSAATSLREFAIEQRARAERLIRRAERAEAAAAKLEAAP